MSTRAIFTFKDADSSFHVYMHCDGYPSGAANAVRAIIEQGKAWDLPRYEADEFAAAFVAANKVTGGHIRLANSRRAASDVQYGYTVSQTVNGLQMTVVAIDGWDAWKETKIWTGTLSAFLADGAMDSLD